MYPIDVVTEALARAGSELRGTSARCPAHDDHVASLSVTVAPDGKVLLNCHSPTCTTEDVLAALGLSMSDLFPPRDARGEEFLATYVYETTPPMRVVRRAGKRFFQQHQGPGGTWEKGSVPAKDRVLYRRSELLARAASGGDVFVVEGEKDVESLRSKGECATCNLMGAGKWLPHYAEDFTGCSRVIVVADKDEPGRRHAREVADSLRPVVPTVLVCEALVGKDVTDHLLAGHGVDELVVIEDDHDDQGDEGEGLLVLNDWSQVREQVDDVVEGLVMHARWTQFVAPAKAGKSSVELWVAIELSEGRDPFDGTSVDPVPILFCDGEMGRDDLEELIRACGHDPAHLKNLYTSCERVRLDTEDGAARLLGQVDRLGARVVILDGLNGFVDPRASENDDTTWRPFVVHTSDPLKRRGVALVSGDNMGKDPTKGSRGSSVKTDKADGVIQLHRTDKGVRLHPSHGRGGAYITKDLSLDAEGFDRSRPIRYRRASGSWPAGTRAGADLLDALGVPVGAGRRKVRARLHEEVAKAEAAGLDADRFRVSNEVLSAALRYRRTVFRPSEETQ